MTLEVDHVFVCTADARRAEQTLVDFGLQFGRHAVHRGQGTANACAFFDNAYLELLWLHDENELRSDVVRPLGLWERIHSLETGAMPFGIAFRAGSVVIPVDTWAYEAPFLPAGSTLPIVTPRFSFQEPVVFLHSGSRAPATWPEDIRPPLQQCGKNRTLTSVAIHGPLSELSAGLGALCDSGLLAIEAAAEHLLELVWDNGVENRRHDFRPVLPLILRW